MIDTSAALANLLHGTEHDRFAELIAYDATRFMSVATILEAEIVIEARRDTGAREDFDEMLSAFAIPGIDFIAAQGRVA